jgi:hypothetical protein
LSGFKLNLINEYQIAPYFVEKGTSNKTSIFTGETKKGGGDFRETFLPIINELAELSEGFIVVIHRPNSSFERGEFLENL